jgi:hypothetical protein
MAFVEHQCVSLTCDGCDDPWDEEDVGTPHFASREEAVTFAAGRDWVIVGDSMRCRDCARKADCAATGHQYHDWQEVAQAGMIPYRRRWCEHCNGTDFDPPFAELSLFYHAEQAIQGGTE